MHKRDPVRTKIQSRGSFLVESEPESPGIFHPSFQPATTSLT